MNANTKEKLFAFIDAVEVLAQGCVHMAGVADVAKLIDAAEELKNQINKDETIP